MCQTVDGGAELLGGQSRANHRGVIKLGKSKEERLVGRYLLDLASHHAGLEPEKVFHNGQIRRLDSFAQVVFSCYPFVGRGYASPFSILSHFIKLPSGTLG
jgi:hypothetical protein